MSHLLLAACPRCDLVISTGFTEPGLAERVFCGACDASLSVPAWPRTGEGAPPLPLTWRTRVPTEVVSRRGRVHKTTLQPGAVDTGTRVPLVATVHEHPSGEVSLVWEPDFSGCACPQCGAVGRIATFAAALARCPRCGGGPMDLDPGT